MIRYYNIHNMLSFSINDDSNPIFPLIDDKFIYFRQENASLTKNIDLSVTFTDSYDEIGREIGDFNGNYFISENIFCRKYVKKGLEFTLVIKLDDSDRIQLIFYEKKKNIWELINKNMISYNIILRVIEFMLLKKGSLLVHAAAVEKDGYSHVFVGRGGSLKTSICLNLIKNHDFNYLGDDRIIVKDGYAYSFPMNYSLFNYMIKNRSDEFISTKDKIQYLISHQKYLNFTKIAPSKSKIENVFFIYRCKGEPEKMPELEDVTSKLVTNNFMENFIDLSALKFNHSPIFDYMIFQSYFNQDILEETTETQARLFEEAFQNAKKTPILIGNISTKLVEHIQGLIQDD